LKLSTFQLCFFGCAVRAKRRSARSNLRDAAIERGVGFKWGEKPVANDKFTRIGGPGLMNFDAFISYANQDKAAADAACAKLEADGIRCWIAPRDVPPGAQWAAAIVDAIDHCRAMVLIFSSSANRSQQIHREVQRAFEREVPVVPFRIENVVPEQALAYYMGPVHWLDALTPPLEQHLQKLVASLKPFATGKTFGERASEARGPQAAEADKGAETDRSRRPEPRQRWQPSQWSVLVACVVAVVLAGSVGVWLGAAYWRPIPPGPQVVQTPSPATPADSNKVTLQSGLAGYWPLDDTTTNWTTNTTQDVSGHGHTGLLIGMSPTKSPTTGKIGQALKFNGSTSYIIAGTNPIMGTGRFTIAGWIKNKTTSADYGIAAMIGNCNLNSMAFIGYVTLAQVGWSNSIGGGIYGINYGSGFTDANWHHVVFTFSGGASGTATLYVDGVSRASGTMTPSLESNVIMMGKCNTGPSFPYQGALDDVRIYDRAISAQEIAQLYSMGQ
jgi:hypothetical protein